MSNPRYLAFAALAAGPLLGMSPLLGSSALAAACATASVSVYEAAGFSCSVGPVTFSDITAVPTISGSGTVTLSDFSPFTTMVDGVTESGLDLFFSADTGATPGSTADVGLTFNVSGVPNLVDAFATFAGTTTGTGHDDLSEVLSNGASLSLSAPGSTSAIFSAIGSLSVVKDQSDFAGSAGSGGQGGARAVDLGDDGPRIRRTRLRRLPAEREASGARRLIFSLDTYAKGRCEAALSFADGLPGV
jgi:hypothetical protein